MSEYTDVVERLKVTSTDCDGGELGYYGQAARDALALLKKYREGLERLASGHTFDTDEGVPYAQFWADQCTAAENYAKEVLDD